MRLRTAPACPRHEMVTSIMLTTCRIKTYSRNSEKISQHTSSSMGHRSA